MRFAEGNILTVGINNLITMNIPVIRFKVQLNHENFIINIETKLLIDYFWNNINWIEDDKVFYEL
jgi:hypothetical protein